ncbi:hypothetical protein SteCoe_9374 [Stentor coeruleus]|uniref:Uncharacterized protein n=1 Tax=Stentor coeruleus TaxID=5963 RepID=A0A1R2CI88_9CILI|nr:hypothetical protein SteCoe_9374 [Stentor coeruleus]
MKLLFSLSVLILLLLNISLLISAFSSTKWSTINSNKNLSLFSCTDCEQLQDNWNFECLARTTCENDSKLGECNLYKDLYKGSFAFLVLEFGSLLMSLLFLEKLIFLILKFPSGPRVSFLGVSIFMLIFHVTGTITWFSYTNAGINCPIEKNNNTRPSVCMNTGSNISIANCILMGGTIILFIISYLKTITSDSSFYIHKKFIWISGTIWLWTSLVFAFITLILMLGSLTVKNWIKFQGSLGSLFRCDNCDSVQWMSWSCLQGTACEINNDSNDCKLYRKLAHASDYFLSLQSLSLILFALYIQSLTVFIKCKVYGNKYLNYAYPILLFIFNVISTISWFATSEGIVNEECTDGDVCVRSGPKLAIASNFTLLMSVCLFLIIYYRRNEESLAFEEIDAKMKTSTNASQAKISKATPDDTQYMKN